MNSRSLHFLLDKNVLFFPRLVLRFQLANGVLGVEVLAPPVDLARKLTVWERIYCTLTMLIKNYETYCMSSEANELPLTCMNKEHAVLHRYDLMRRLSIAETDSAAHGSLPPLAALQHQRKAVKCQQGSDAYVIHFSAVDPQKEEKAHHLIISVLAVSQEITSHKVITAAHKWQLCFVIKCPQLEAVKMLFFKNKKTSVI